MLTFWRGESSRSWTVNVRASPKNFASESAESQVRLPSYHSLKRGSCANSDWRCHVTLRAAERKALRLCWNASGVSAVVPLRSKKYFASRNFSFARIVNLSVQEAVLYQGRFG